MIGLRHAVLTVGGQESLERFVKRADGTRVGSEAMVRMWERMMASAPAGPSGDAAPAARQPTPEQMREQQRLMAYQLAEAVVGG